MFDKWRSELQLDVVETNEEYRLTDFLEADSNSPVGWFYARRWKNKGTLIFIFRVGQKRMALVDIADPRFYRVYDQFIAHYSNCWMFADTALMTISKLTDFLRNVKKYEDYPVKVEIT